MERLSSGEKGWIWYRYTVRLYIINLRLVDPMCELSPNYSNLSLNPIDPEEIISQRSVIELIHLRKTKTKASTYS
jgi:hypothetical protein